jgi:hypothetical protein
MDLRAVIFMPAMAGAVIFAFVTLLFASHYYLTVLEGTATGSKEVTWMSEPILDNFWKLWYMLWLFGLWFGPGYLIAKAIAAGSGSEWVKLWLPVAIVWLLYPVSQLSSLSASTIWLPLVPDVFARLAQKPAVTISFYLLSIPVLALFAVAFQWAFLTKGEWEMLFLGAPLLIIAAFLYARLIGRLAFVLAFTKSLLQRKKKKPRAAAGGEERESGTREAQERGEVVPTIRQPSDLPPIVTVEGELTGYDLRLDDTPAPRKRVVAEVADAEDEPENEDEPRPKPPPLPRSARRPTDHPERARNWTDEDEDEPAAYGVHEPEVVPVETTPREVVEPKESEMRLLSRDDVPKQPERAWNPELLAFLGQVGTISALAIASGLCFVVGVFVRVCRDFNPLD